MKYARYNQVLAGVKKMKRYKFIGFLILILMLSFNVIALEVYDKEDYVPINAQYTQGGVLSSANANLTVTFPNGTIDARYSNYGLSEVSTGIFQGTYNTTNTTGRYKALVIFYNGTNELGRDVQYFEVGDITFNLGDGFNENRFSIIFLLIVCVGLYLFEILFHTPIVGIIGGFGVILLSISFFSYSALFGLIILLSGMAMSLHSLFRKV